jgi:hypothetical protein
MTKKSDKDQYVFTVSPIQGALLRQFHREILMNNDLDVAMEAFHVIFDRPEEEIYPHELLVMKEFCRAHAEEWGSPDLAAPVEGITTTTFGVIKGGKLQ